MTIAPTLAAMTAPPTPPRDDVTAAIPASDRVIKNAESTEFPVWFIVTGTRRPVLWAGPFFSRATAESHLQTRRGYPKNAVVYCASGHMSADYRHLCETGTVPHAR